MSKFRLDEVDHQILDMLIDNTRVPFTDIAKKLHTKHAKDVIFMIDDIDGVYRTETMISLEESINDKKRLMHTIFKNM
jgi:DNA-binding Lrp family transcriptional regulator